MAERGTATLQLRVTVMGKNPSAWCWFDMIPDLLVYDLSCFNPLIYDKDNTAAAESLQSCLTLRDPRDGSPPGSPAPGVLQARTLEWAAISYSNA